MTSCKPMFQYPWLPAGIGAGIAIGVALGALFDRTASGIAIGLALGMLPGLGRRVACAAVSADGARR